MRYSGKLKGCASNSGLSTVDRKTTRLPRGVMMLSYRIFNDNLKRWKCTKTAVSSASDAIRKKRLSKVFMIPNCLKLVCSLNVRDKDGGSL